MYIKREAKVDEAVMIATRIKAIDYELIGICCGPSCPLTLKAADRLARIQRELRALRHEIELEGRFETAPMVVPRRTPGGGPELRVVHGDRRGEASA